MTGAANTIKEQGMKKIFPQKVRIAVGMGTCGIGNGADEVYRALEKKIKKRKLKIYLTKTGCFGFCAQEPLVNVQIPGKPLVIFKQVKVADVNQLMNFAAGGKIPPANILCKIESWHFLAGKHIFGKDYPNIPLWNEIPFFKGQKKIVLRNAGLINPEDIEEYVAVGGYSALDKALKSMTPVQVIEEVKKSKLRGRGGAGFPTGIKWELMQKVPAEEKYIICNADEGDPGAYMNRNEIESDPHSLIEGMIIGAYGMGASKGIVYARAEYPLAVERLKLAIRQARECGLLGKNILGSTFSFDIDVVEGAGAFVCGEETALMASIESETGRPRPRPPFPAEKGLYGKPTTINNVETWFNIPVIIGKGFDWFTHTGTDKSACTKVFSLVGKIKNTGLVELPLGTPLKTIVYNIGEGTGTKRRVKAVQTGGPSGGCIPVELFETVVDYETLGALGAIMGSGGMVVMDDDNCMVDVARYFTEFTTSESCGKCTPCREGLFQLLKMVKDVTDGHASPNVLADLDELGTVIKDTALCGLGQTAPNPVLTTMKYFHKEYIEHIQENRCDAGVCQPLFLSPCENDCPLHMNIPGYLELFKEQRLEDSFEMIMRYNPLPASTGRICHFHCKMRCRREDLDQPIASGESHRYIADTIYKAKKEKAVIEKLVKGNFPKTGKKVSIIGAGPAGLTAGFYLARLGYDVTIYEAQAEPGGILRYGIPEYRLPKAVLKKEIENIKKFGVKILCNQKIGTDGLKKITKASDAVFVATGAYKDMMLDIPGEYLKGVMAGSAYLEDIALGKKVALGKDVLIIGAGNVAIDAARTAFRFGVNVTVVYRREKEDMPANKDEISEAEKEGIKFVFLAAPKEILGDGKNKVKALKVEKMIPGEFDLSGRKRPAATGETYDIACDTILLAIGERVESEFLSQAGILVNKNGTVQANHVTLKTNLPNVFAGGDLVMGPATAVEAMAHGLRVTQAIDRQLSGEDRLMNLFAPVFVYENIVPTVPHPAKRQQGKKLGLKQRKGSFKEISAGLTGAQVKVEALRCLRCDVKES
ncbi:MAG: FAD-dependent oxidoreductase [Candidatus Omnitrophica bacterium]|nr:FAD-dependent oxidoreductase [Candidatus Omnitrophota bacterium]